MGWKDFNWFCDESDDVNTTKTTNLAWSLLSDSKFHTCPQSPSGSSPPFFHGNHFVGFSRPPFSAFSFPYVDFPLSASTLPFCPFASVGFYFAFFHQFPHLPSFPSFLSTLATHPSSSNPLRKIVFVFFYFFLLFLSAYLPSFYNNLAYQTLLFFALLCRNFWNNFSFGSDFSFALSFFCFLHVSFLLSFSIPCFPPQPAPRARLTWKASPSRKFQNLAASRQRCGTSPAGPRTRKGLQKRDLQGTGQIQKDPVGCRSLAQTRSCGGGGDDVVVERWLQPLCWKLLWSSWEDWPPLPPVGRKHKILFCFLVKIHIGHSSYLLGKTNWWKFSFIIGHKDNHPDPVKPWSFDEKNAWDRFSNSQI